jgi:hypothetical protein
MVFKSLRHKKIGLKEITQSSEEIQVAVLPVSAGEGGGELGVLIETS